MSECDCGSPATVVEAAGTSIARTASYEYDFQGKRWKTTTHEGSMSTNHYDLLGRLVLVQDPFGWSTNRYDNLGHVYDAADRRTWISRTNSTSTTWNGFSVFGYDAGSQLTTARTTNAANTEVTSERFGYVYDASQNLRWRTNNTTVTGFTNNVLNQLTALNAMARDHDRRGNLVSNVQAGETLLYSWDDESQLTSVRVDPAAVPMAQPWRIDFVYDGLRRLRRALQFTWNGSAWTSQGEVRYLYDGMLILQERNSGNTPQVQYTRGLDLSGTIEGAGGIGGLLMRSHGYSAGNWSTHNAYHSDANGNVTALMNSSGVLQASYKYNPYGGLISSSGTLAGANTMRFSSKPAIFSTTGAWGFYYYGYRFYDPGMQRWLNRDPLGEEGGVNLYLIVENDPVGRLDPLGLETVFQLRVPKPAPWCVASCDKQLADCMNASTIVCSGIGATAAATAQYYNKTGIKPPGGVAGGGRSGRYTSRTRLRYGRGLGRTIGRTPVGAAALIGAGVVDMLGLGTCGVLRELCVGRCPVVWENPAMFNTYNNLPPAVVIQ
jgi:RHS repeat-associated protein